MRADAQIAMRSDWHEDPLNPGHGYVTHTPVAWEGGAIAALGWDYVREFTADATTLDVGDYLYIGSWLCEVVTIDAFSFRKSIGITRCTSWAWWYAFRFRVAAQWLPFKGRVLATCAVWGLARYDWGAEPSWSEIYAIAWLKAKVKR